jgi:hypothetical protein
MPKDSCEKCGNDILPAMKFCRKCGHPTGNAAIATQVLGSTSAIGAPTTVLNSDAKTGPAQSPQTAPASEPTKPRSSRLPIVIAVLIVILAAALICAFVLRGKPHTEGTQQTTESSGPTSGGYSSVGIDQKLIYPGSKPGMSVGRQNRTTAQFQTSDPIGKVIDWYKYRMKVSEVKLTPGGQQAVVTLDKSTVTLTSAGTVTNITITQDR